MTYADIAPTITKSITPRVTQSEYPFRVQCYQFMGLEDARKFSSDLAAIPRSNHRHHVGMFHRKLTITKTVGGVNHVDNILLDVTEDSPEEAEAKWTAPK